MSRMLVKNGEVIPLPDEPMTEQDRLISDVTRLLIHINRTDILRFIRQLVFRIAQREGYEPEKILDDAYIWGDTNG